MPDNSLFGSDLRAQRLVPACARRAFTLVELLLVIIILTILASIILFAMFSSQEAARAAKTRNMISKLNALVMPKYESYMSRRVPLRATGARAQIAYTRLHGIRDLMRMEMPERWADLEDIVGLLQAPSAPSQVTGIPLPALARTYVRRILTAHPNRPARQRDEWQSAECLYLIVSIGLDEPDAISQFSENEIGDTDKDGLKEFLDGWNRPIRFLRWPAGFDSPLQTRAAEEFANGDPSRPKTDIDQFNSRRIADLPSNVPNDRKPPFENQTPPRNNSRRGFALYPLIYSGGPDQKFDISSGDNGELIYYYHPHPGPPTSAPTPKYIDPYLYLADATAPTDLSKKWQVGQPYDNDQDGEDNSRDNIHNHDMSNLR
jgi:prepilin-type N-terminal cleavage/methylation domain-containing protein